VRSRIEDGDVAVTYAGAWTLDNTGRAWSGTSLASGIGTAVRSETAGASAEMSFRGTSVSWVGLQGPTAGIADVYLDGAFVTRVDLYAPTEQVQAVLFTASALSTGTHTLRIQATGEKNPAATTARVFIDAFDVVVATPAPPVARAQETDAAIAYTGVWVSGGHSTLFSGEDSRQSVAVGARATLTFSGTAVRWIGERGFATGVARVSLDGQFVAQVDTRSSFQEEYQMPLLTLTGLAPGTHTLTIEVVGRNGEAPGTSVERVVVDAFDIQ